MVTNIFLILIGLVRLLIAVSLLQVASRQELPNLRWLAFGFLATVIGIPFTAQPYVPFIDKIISYIAYLCFAVFIHQTFYQGKRSPFAIFWTIFTLLYVAMLWTTNNFLTELTGTGFPGNLFTARPPVAGEPGGVAMVASEITDAVIYGSLQLAIWLWHAIAAARAYSRVKEGVDVAEWVKGRYRLMIAYSVLQSLVGVVMIMRPFASDAIINPVIYGSALLVIGTTTMQYLVWAMPDPFKNWLNRQQPAESGKLQQSSPQNVVAMLSEISQAMCHETGLTPMRSGFALRQSIGARINTEDGEKIEAYANKMNFEQWESLLADPNLSRQLANVSTPETSKSALYNARQTLIRKQSLLTMQAR